MAQTTYNEAPARSFAGLIADTSVPYVDSRANEEVTSVPFGIMMAAGTDPEKQTLLPAAVTDVMLGVLVHKHTQERTGLDAGATGDIMTQGHVWVVVEEAVTPADDVFVRCVSTGAEQSGAFRTDADGTDAVQVTSARFVSSTSGAGLAILAINLP